MTEKRFRYEGAKIFDGEELLCCTLSIWVEQLVDLLNELHEENQELKKDLERISEWYKLKDRLINKRGFLND